jgi:GxxExxY protein
MPQREKSSSIKDDCSFKVTLERAAHRIYSQLGSFQMEKVYQVALSMELSDQSIQNQMEVICPIYYLSSVTNHRWLVGEGYIDIVVPAFNAVVEIKHADKVSDADVGQVKKYLSSKYPCGYLVVFPKKQDQSPIVTECFLMGDSN